MLLEELTMSDVPSFADSPDEYTSSYSTKNAMTREQRRQQRQKRKSAVITEKKYSQESSEPSSEVQSDDRFYALMQRNEDDLLQFVAKVNKVYQELLKRDAPFMTFVFCGMQSAGKSTIMERFLNSVLNIVQEGTGTRCPLDATCIHDNRFLDPSCDLSGEELPMEQWGNGLTVNEVFERITEHNKELGRKDEFSTKPLNLVYRARNVQNMRFVDTPGIISNKSTGKDNREDIKTILRSEMRKANTKLCVLLEPKEFATNSIVDFCDESFGGRSKWISSAAFLMTKFDKQMEDSRSASKANGFFKEFFNNQCYPHLIITPTLAKEDLPPDVLFQSRMKLIHGADEYEKDKFDMWNEGHERFRNENGGDEDLDSRVTSRIGFSSAKKVMREIMIKDTVERLPEVVASLRRDLDRCKKEEKLLKDKKTFNDPANLRRVVNQMLSHIQERIHSYLDGDLGLSLKFPERLQTLEEEIEEEEESDWASRELNFHTEKENHWRDRIANLKEDLHDIQADRRYLGGKQYQRAIEFFRIVMIDSLPDPYQLKDLVPNVTGYLSDGLQRENWERAMVQITRVSLKEVSHPGINYLIKHVGCIFRRLFLIALEDIKHGEEFSAQFKLIPNGLEKFLVGEFDEMLWELLESVGKETHSSLEPMYSTIDPNLPTFHAKRLDNQQEAHFVQRGDQYVLVDNQEEEELKQSWFASITNRFSALTSKSGSAARGYLLQENRKRSNKKKSFLPDERTSMITDDETNLILQRSFEYIVALMEFNLFVFKFQMNHHLYQGFKNSVRSTLMSRVNEADWDELVQADPGIDERLQELDSQIKGLSDSLLDVQRMQRCM